MPAPRHFGEAAVATQQAAARVDLAEVARGAIGPHHHLAAVAARLGIGLDTGARAHEGAVGAAVAGAVHVATHQHGAAAGVTRRVDVRRADQANLVAHHGHRAARFTGAAARNVDLAADQRHAARSAVDHDAAVLQPQGAGLHHAAHVEHGVGELAARGCHQLDRAAVGLDATELLQARAGLAAIDLEEQQAVAFHIDQHLVGRDQAHAPAIGLDRAAVEHIGARQHHRATRGVDAALVDNAPRQVALPLAVVGQQVAAGQEVGVAQAQRGGDQAAHIDPSVGAEHDAVGVLQEDATVGLQLPEDVAGVVAQHREHRGRGAARLVDGEPLLRADAEGLRVDDGLLLPGRHHHGVGVGPRHLHRADHGLQAGGQRLRALGEHQRGQGQRRQREAGGHTMGGASAAAGADRGGGAFHGTTSGHVLRQRAQKYLLSWA